MNKVFFVGIGGIGMSGLALILKSKGIQVVGSDRNESDKTKELERIGIKVYIGHDKRNITDDIDLVVYTNAVSDDNPEIQEARLKGIRTISRAELLADIEKNYFSIGISGTHGKTTTTSMVSKILLDAGLDPTVSNGGNLAYIGGNARVGNSKYFVYEACEAFGSFLHFRPDIGVITSVDNDHIAEYYKTMDNVIKAFATYINNVKPDGIVILNGDDPNTVNALLLSERVGCITYGVREGNHIIADKIKLKSKTTEFDVYFKEKYITTLSINIPGMHNVYNSLAAFGVAISLGISPEIIVNSLRTFKNAERRFEVKYENEHITIIDDYGHHPAEIKATLTSAKNLGKEEVIAIFQPHLWSRTYYLYRDFALALNIADKIIITEVYGAREKQIDGVSAKMIADELIKLGREKDTFFVNTKNEAAEIVSKITKHNSVVVILGAGDINKIFSLLLEKV
ncbi:MAG: UDP-N-acetylmuramate--L-alanine ligase [Brevinematales bacterium]|nr:UDP-N-acetylmuramate--L-alanine ligase [Brevinematales bacterium]